MATRATSTHEDLKEAEPIRQKSGLVRTAGGVDSFVVSLASISVGIMFCWGSFFGLGFYPGAHLLLSIVIATAVSLLVAWSYQYWAQIFPRSGGDYVFLSRGLHPGFALGANIVYIWALLAAPAFAMGIMQPVVSSLAATLADATGWGFLGNFSGWVLTNTGFAIIGTFVLAVPSLIAVVGLKASINFMKGLFIVGAGGLVITTIALLLSSSDTFIQNLESVTGLTVAEINTAATESGFVSGDFSLEQTTKMSVWYTSSLFFAVVLVYIGGEIKNVQRNVRYAMIAAVAFAGLATIIWVEALNSVVPTSLQGALAWNSLFAPESTTPGAPYGYELMGVLWGASGGGLILTLIAAITIVAWVWIWAPLILSLAQRAVLAWALDGLLPKWFSSVSRRWHTPIPAIIAAFAMAEIAMLLLAFKPNLRTIVLLVPAYALLAFTLFIGALFPYIRKHFYDQSVIAKSKVLGIPMMTIFCGIAAVVVAYWTWLLWDDPVASGTDRRPVWIAIGILVAATVYYIGLRLYKRRQGADISVTFKRIPIE